MSELYIKICILKYEIYMENTRSWHIYPKSKKQTESKIKFSSSLDHVNHMCGSYISRTKKSEPNRKSNKYSNFYNIVYIFIIISYIQI